MTKKINKLIEELKINDDISVKLFHDVEFEKLISLGERAVDPLIDLFEQDPKVTKWSTVYALEILCRIGGPKATDALLRFFRYYNESPEEYGNTIYEISEYMANENHSPRLSVNTILRYLQETENRKAVWDFLLCATEGGLRDERLFSLFLEGLDSEDSDIVTVSVLALGDYGDKRAVPSLSKLLERCPLPNEVPKGARSAMPDVLQSLRLCVNLSEYRKILTKNPSIVRFYTNLITDQAKEIKAKIYNLYSKAHVRNKELNKLTFHLETIFLSAVKLGLYDDETVDKIAKII